MGTKKLKSQGRYFPAVFFLASARRSVFFRRLARFLALSLPLLFPIRPQHSPSCRAAANSQADSSPVQLFCCILNPCFGSRSRKFRSLNAKCRARERNVLGSRDVDGRPERVSFREKANQRSDSNERHDR